MTRVLARHGILRTRLVAALALASCLEFIGFSCSLPGQVSGKQSIHVRISGMRNDKGQIDCALFASPAGFPREGKKAVAHLSVPISGESASCDFTGVTSGTYAVAVFHDENGNGKMDTNLIGMPREGVGASNNAKGHFGPPKFADAAFTVAASDVSLKITMIYL